MLAVGLTACTDHASQTPSTAGPGDARCEIAGRPDPSRLTLSISGSGICGSSLESTLTVPNDAGGTCASDILATLQPGNTRMMFASTSGSGGATGRWQPLPADSEGVGVMLYPVGQRSWPVMLPALAPGTYTFVAPSVDCGTDRSPLSGTFDVTAA